MTAQLRACVVCFRQWVSQPGEVKCAACNAGRTIPNNTATKRPTLPPEVKFDLPENLAGARLEALATSPPGR